jgi:hypothetical protein
MSWSKQLFKIGDCQYFQNCSVLINRQLELLGDSLERFESAQGSVPIGPEERKSIRLGLLLGPTLNIY